jgi:hypothetical protein
MRSKLAARTVRALEAGYSITDTGQVLAPEGHALKATPNPQGYLKFAVVRSLADRDRIVYVHQLAALQWFGLAALAEGAQVRHLDGNPANNNRGNIDIGDASANQLDIKQKYRKARSEKAALVATPKVRRFSEAEVRRIRNRHAKGTSLSSLAETFDSCKSTMSYIVNRKTYASVS